MLRSLPSLSEQNSSFQCKLDALARRPAISQGILRARRGQHDFAVHASDLAGNTDASPAERGFTVDTVRPDAPTITSPQSDSYDTDGTITVSGSAGFGAKVQLFEGAPQGDGDGRCARQLEYPAHQRRRRRAHLHGQGTDGQGTSPTPLLNSRSSWTSRRLR